MFFIYQIIIFLILILSPLIIIIRILKNKEDKKRFTEKFSIPSKKRLKGKLIWFHGASVGEILSIVPLIKYYEKKEYIDQILITSSTLSSSKVLRKFKFKKTIHQFYPIDNLYLTNKFLNFWKPSTAIFVDSETETKIQNALKILTKNKTTIVIAHRLSTILNSNNIYVVDSGKIIDSGKHDDLMNNCELYKSFYEKQIQK